MKKNLSYMDSVHRDGTIWNLGVMALLIAFPLTVAAVFGAPPDWAALAVGLLMRKPKLKWLGDYALPISLVLGMISAIPITAWLG